MKEETYGQVRALAQLIRDRIGEVMEAVMEELCGSKGSLPPA